MVVSFHIGSGEFNWDRKRTESRGFTETYVLQSVHLFNKNGLQVCDLLLSGVLPRFPQLRVVSVESGIGWLPFTFEAMDHQFVEGGGFRARPEFEKLPSEYFADQVYATFWFEEAALRNLQGSSIPVDNVLFETDFPHPTCLYDDVDAKLAASIGHLPDDVQRKLLWDNAAALYRIPAPEPALA
jgi:predicted TIM-barrel fold metal-dependent hydrolase